MGVYMCSTGQHILFISVAPMRSFKCDCPPHAPITRTWSNVTPRVNNPEPGYDFISRKAKKR